MRKSVTLQPSQPLLGVINLSNTKISAFPEVEEFLVVLHSFVSPVYFMFCYFRMYT